jgi:methionyl aminopeptidase
MAIAIKSPEQIAARRAVGRAAWGAVQGLVQGCRIGMTTRELEALARERIVAAGLRPVMLGYRAGQAPAFTGAASICINEEVVHAGPSDRIIREGDVVSIDLAACDEDGWHADAATSLVVGQASERAARVVGLARQALDLCVRMAGPGVKWSTVARGAEQLVRGGGCHLAAGYTGHGIGQELHEPPRLCFGDVAEREDVCLRPGMVLTVEPLVVEGSGAELVTLDDGWTVVAAGRELSAHEEVTLAITRCGAEVLTAN